ncbi:hypothetical protein LOK49_LG12G02928 [Camellia lanceoleosa]|uniref:Uncharacterized protein n=1 Tax=Camellia lanceoleosa TaxID=1840588 RepID=A0ACC0FP24_9ERIC|nr:hypothetical protein LOK49_LG12G02928 [Camellia lanceoleosa]
MAGFSHSNNKLDSISLEDGAESMAAIAHCCLVRKFIAPKQFNRQVILSILQGAWKARVSSIAPWNDNLFLFSFDDAEDRRFMGYLRTNSPNQMVNGETIGRKIGRLFCVEAHCEGLLIYQNFLRIRVEMDITKPLAKGLGYDWKSSKFVTREEGGNSSYGPELQTGIAQSTSLSVEHYRKQVDTAAERMRTLM